MAEANLSSFISLKKKIYGGENSDIYLGKRLPSFAETPAKNQHSKAQKMMIKIFKTRDKNVFDREYKLIKKIRNCRFLIKF